MTGGPASGHKKSRKEVAHAQELQPISIMQPAIEFQKDTNPLQTNPLQAWLT